MERQTRDLKAWAVFGAVVFLAFIAILTRSLFLHYRTIEHDRWLSCTQLPESASCEPGPLWWYFEEFFGDQAPDSGDEEARVLGVTKASDARVVNFYDRQAGEVCGTNFGYCSVGLVCQTHESKTVGECVPRTESSPFALSLKLEGMSLDQGLYVGEAGSDVRIVVQTVGADTVEAFVYGHAIPLSRGEAGQYTGVWTLPAELDDVLVVRVGGADEISALSVPVLSVQ